MSYQGVMLVMLHWPDSSGAKVPFPVEQLWKSVKRGLRSSSVPSTRGFNSSYYSSEEECMFDLLLFKSVQLPVGISLCFSYPCRSTTSSRHCVTTRFDGCTSRLSDQNIKDPNLAELQLAVNQPKFIKCYANNWWIMLVVCYPKKPASQTTTNAWKKKLKAQNPQHTKQVLNTSGPFEATFATTQTKQIFFRRIGAPFSAKSPPRTVNSCDQLMLRCRESLV